MFCEERITKVYLGVQEYDDLYSANEFLDCYHDLAYHCTKGYRIVLETEHYAISLSANGVLKESKEDLREGRGEWLRNGVEDTGPGDPPWVHFETTLFVGERLLSVTQQDELFLLRFDDFTLKLIPHADGGTIEGLHNQCHWSYNHVYGCDRHLRAKCPHCGSEGEILMDFVSDYIVRCKNCKESTWAAMNLKHAIEDWNNGELHCTADDITIE